MYFVWIACSVAELWFYCLDAQHCNSRDERRGLLSGNRIALDDPEKMHAQLLGIMLQLALPLDAN